MSTHLADPIQYIVVHQSVAKDPGVLACQVAHAVWDLLGAEFHTLSEEGALGTGRPRACVLVAQTAGGMEDLSSRLVQAQIGHSLVHEPDAPYNGSATALATLPGDQAVLQPYFTQFKLLRK